MNKTPVLDTPAGDTTYEAEVDHYMTEMKRLQQQMQDDRREIQSLQAETQAILADIMQTLRAA